MAESIGKQVARGTLWSGVDKFGGMALQFISNLVLARILMPSDYGAIGMLMIFIAVSQVIIDGGFGSALIQKKSPTQTDYSTIFLWSVGLGALLYLILFLCAPLIARFYSMPELSSVLRVVAMSIVLMAMSSIQINRLQKQLGFKAIAVGNISAQVVGATVGIWMAVGGAGVWSLVGSWLSSAASRVVILFLASRWLPSPVFSLRSLRELFSFGGYLFLANVLETVCKNLQGLVIGKKFSAAQLGYFSQAQKLDNITSYAIPQVIATVMYPVFSRFQDDRRRIVEIMNMDVRVIAFMLFPVFTILILEAAPVIELLYGAKWLPAAPFYRILCVGGYFYCLNNIAFYAVAACGKSRQLFFASIAKWGCLALFLLIGMNFGMTGIVWSLSVGYINIFLINAALAWKYVGNPVHSVIRQFLPVLALALAAGAAAFLLQECLGIPWGAVIPVYAALYLGGAFLFRLRAVKETKEILLKLKK